MLGARNHPAPWPENMWADDASGMADLGLKCEGIGKFAWSALEPTPGSFNWGWLAPSIRWAKQVSRS